MISVIIPTYGIPVFLEKSINSVLNQTYTEWELIIVDDNNPDTEARKDTETIVNKYLKNDSRVKYIKHKKNLNGAVARNTGLSIANGEYIAFLDSDDEYLPERLMKCYNAIVKAPKDVAGIYTGCEFRRKGKTYHQHTNVKSGNFLIETLACKFMFCTGSNIFVRRNIIDELRGFDETFLRQQDYEFLVRLFEKYTLLAIPEILVIKNNENFNLPNINSQIAIRKKYLEKFKYIVDQLMRKDVDYIMHANYIGIAENAMQQSHYKVANEYYCKAKRFAHLSFREWLRRILFPLYNHLK